MGGTQRCSTTLPVYPVLFKLVCTKAVTFVMPMSTGIAYHIVTVCRYYRIGRFYVLLVTKWAVLLTFVFPS